MYAEQSSYRNARNAERRLQPRVSFAHNAENRYDNSLGSACRINGGVTVKQAEKSFPFDKSMMLNVIYDTLERLGISVINSNSEQGLMSFHNDQANDYVLCIETMYPQKTVRVTLASETEEIDNCFADTLFEDVFCKG